MVVVVPKWQIELLVGLRVKFPCMTRAPYHLVAAEVLDGPHSTGMDAKPAFSIYQHHMPVTAGLRLRSPNQFVSNEDRGIIPEWQVLPSNPQNLQAFVRYSLQYNIDILSLKIEHSSVISTFFGFEHHHIFLGEGSNLRLFQTTTNSQKDASTEA